MRVFKRPRTNGEERTNNIGRSGHVLQQMATDPPPTSMLKLHILVLRLREQISHTRLQTKLSTVILITLALNLPASPLNLTMCPWSVVSDSPPTAVSDFLVDMHKVRHVQYLVHCV